MLVLTRRVGEEIVIGDDVCLRVVRIEGSRVRLGISAPDHILVRRVELCAQQIDPSSAEHEGTAGTQSFAKFNPKARTNVQNRRDQKKSEAKA